MTSGRFTCIVYLTSSCKVLELFFRDSFYRVIFQTPFPDEKYSGTSSPTSPYGPDIQDAAVTSVHRCTF